MSTDDHVEKLERFFKEVADLTANHKVIAGEAVVYPSALGEALSRVDPDWYHTTAAYDQELGLFDDSTFAAAVSRITPDNRYPEISVGPEVGKEAIDSDSNHNTGDS